MKKLVVITLLLFAGTAFAYHNVHFWNKAAEFTDNNGRTVCSWTCNNNMEPHSVTTGGQGMCPYPN